MATLNISKDQGAASAIAFAEVMGVWGYKQYRSQLVKALDSVPHGSAGKQLAHLYKAAEAAKAGGDDAGYRANRAAMTVIARTEYIQSNQEKGVNSLEGYTEGNLTAAFDRIYARGKALSGGGSASALEERSGYNSKKGGSLDDNAPAKTGKKHAPSTKPELTPEVPDWAKVPATPIKIVDRIPAFAKKQPSDNQFEAGEYITSGMKPAVVADGYIRANAAEIGANGKNITQSFNVVNTVVSKEGITNFDKALARVRELRTEHLGRASEGERKSLGLSYDLAAIHLQLQKEVAAFNKKDSDSPGQLASIGQLRSRANSNSLGALNKHGESLRTDRVANLSAFESALQLELTGSDRTAVKKIFDDIKKVADERGVTGHERNKLYRQEFEKRDDAYFGESMGDKARRVWDRAVKIANDRDNTGGSIFKKPPSAPASESAPADGTAATATSSADHLQLALDQVLKGKSAETRTAVINLINGAEGDSTPEKMAYLSELLNEPGAEEDAFAPHTQLALGVLNLKQRMDKKPSVTKFSGAGEEAHLELARKMGDEFSAKRTAGEDIAKEGVASGKRGRFTSEERKVIIERNAGRYAEIDPELQAKLEAKGFSTGQRAGVDVTDLSQLDGILGDKTKASIEKLLGREITIPLDDKTLAELTEKLDAAPAQKDGAAKPKADTQAPTDEVVTESTTVLRSKFAKEVDAVKAKSTTPINFYNDEEVQAKVKEKIGKKLSAEAINDDPTGIIRDQVNEGIKKGTVDKLKADKIKLTQADIDDITVNKGIVYSPLLAKIETALGLSVVDGKMDANLKEIMDIPAIKAALAEAYANKSMDSLAELVTPTVPGGKAKGNEKA